MLLRSDFTRERFDALALASGGPAPLTNVELTHSRTAVLGAHPLGEDLWVFAYGSLIWNPAISVLDTRPAKLSGWHRSFCLDLPGGRGSRERPGLMCALVPSGHCNGVAHRIAAADLESETTILWLREMAYGAYRACLAPVDVDERSVNALVFVAQPTRVEVYDLSEQARRIAVAEGPIGTNREYLFLLEEALQERQLIDRYVTTLAHLVRAVAGESGRWAHV